MIGTVSRFNRMKGWGFILPDDDTLDDFFVHHSELVGRKFLRVNERVEFTPSVRNDKPYARNVKVIDAGAVLSGGVDLESARESVKASNTDGGTPEKGDAR